MNLTNYIVLIASVCMCTFNNVMLNLNLEGVRRKEPILAIIYNRVCAHVIEYLRWRSSF